ncbi:fimbrial protein [Providencia sp. PROV174]|uniref:fimbrial protein n=1 Tax=Providencia sp. PROV174 TaxID=2949877 RepID=UPI00234BF6C9|nr:fimbrial protein [Providencia sp. PROV174]
MKKKITIRLFLLSVVLLIINNKSNAAYDCFKGQPVRAAYISGTHKINVPFDRNFTGNLKTIKATSSVPLDMYVNNSGKDYNSQCKNLATTNSNTGNVYFQYLYANGQTSQTPLKTNILGVSQYVRFVANHCPSCSSSLTFPHVAYINGNNKYDSTPWIPAYFTLTLTQTGKVTKSGYIDSGLIATKGNRNAAAGSAYHLNTTLSIQPNSIYINVLNCSLNQSVYNINLGDWYDTQFKNTGDTSEMIDIPISLKCNPETNINVTVKSTNGSSSPTAGWLNLASDGNSAKGIAIQLLDNNNNPITLDKKFTQATNVSEGDYIFNWKARYIKTTDKITPGSANASATVNIRYE